MKTIVRYIFIIAMLAAVGMSTTGCGRNPVKPKLDFHGQGYNPNPYDVVAFIDGVQITSLYGNQVIRPYQYTQVVYLRGTIKHHFLVYSVPGATIFRQEGDFVIDGVSDNARLPEGVDETPDWAWIFGGRVQP